MVCPNCGSYHTDQTNQGILNEYYDVFKQALRQELGREPTHEEIMYHVNIIKDKCYGK